MKKVDKIQQTKTCKNKKCKRHLPDGYKYKYCESCRNEHAEMAKGGLKVGLGIVGSAALFIVTKGKFGDINNKQA